MRVLRCCPTCICNSNARGLLLSSRRSIRYFGSWCHLSCCSGFCKLQCSRVACRPYNQYKCTEVRRHAFQSYRGCSLLIYVLRHQRLPLSHCYCLLTNVAGHMLTTESCSPTQYLCHRLIISCWFVRSGTVFCSCYSMHVVDRTLMLARLSDAACKMASQSHCGRGIRSICSICPAVSCDDARCTACRAVDHHAAA